jgi:hypothetical protein
VFADRPVRAAGHDTTAHIIEDRSKGSDSFAKDPPNATVSVFTKDGSGVKDAVVVLKSPNLEGERLTFDVEVLEGDLNGADGAAAVFIVSSAGRSRRCHSPVLPAAWRGAEPIIAGPLSPELRPWVQLPWELPRTITLMVMAIRRRHAVLPISALLLTCST